MFMEKESLMVDMDEVITVGGFLFLINRFLGTHYKEEDFKEYHMQDVIPDKKAFFQWFRRQNMYDYCKLNPGAKETLYELNQVYRLYIGTSYIFPEMVNDSSYIVVQKSQFLQRELPFISPYQYIFLADKSVLQMDIKIDDRMDNLVGARRKLLFSAYHNLDMPDAILEPQGVERVDNWEQVKTKLLKR